MPGFILHQGATVECAHQGQAEPLTPYPRVQVSGQSITTQSTVYSIAGCSLPPPPNGNGPCVSGQWVVAATRVFADGIPVLTQTSQSVCIPTGTPLIISITQVRVSAT